MIIYLIAIIMVLMFSLLEILIELFSKEDEFERCKYYDGSFVFPHCNFENTDAHCETCKNDK